jgi:hypothetical protein
MKTPAAVAAALCITPEVVQARLDAIGLDAATMAHLRDAAPGAAATADVFLESLYRRLLDYPETAALLSTEAQVERLKAHQHHYLRELFELDVDWAYVLRRLWIGVVHHRVRLLPQSYLTTYAHFVCDHLDPIVRSADSEANAREQALAMIKKIFFDASLALIRTGATRRCQWARRAAQGWATYHTTHRPRHPHPRARPVVAGYAHIRLTSENTLGVDASSVQRRRHRDTRCSRWWSAHPRASSRSFTLFMPNRWRRGSRSATDRRSPQAPGRGVLERAVRRQLRSTARRLAHAHRRDSREGRLAAAMVPLGTGAPARWVSPCHPDGGA